MSKKIFAAIFATFLFFFGAEIFQKNSQNLQIFGEKNVTILKFKNQIFFFGDENSAAARTIFGEIAPFFGKKNFLKIGENSRKKFSGRDFSIENFSENFARGNFSGQKILFFKNISEKILHEKISFDADFWILRDKNFPNFLPPPKIAILFLPENRPPKILKNFAAEKKIPLISAAETGGFFLNFSKKMELKIREKN